MCDQVCASSRVPSFDLRPSECKGRKLAWQGVGHENTMMLRMRMLPRPLLVNQPAGGEGGVVHDEGSCMFMRLEIPAPPIPC